MKAPAFRYCRPETVEEALEVLERFGDEARVLAGGQSLLASLNMRLSSPQVLVDINRLQALRGIEETAAGLRIGAVTRHAEVEHSPLVARRAPLLSTAVRHVAHGAVRNRGTFGGSLALADPAAEMPAVAVALEAVMRLRSKQGERQVPAESFFRGLYETALQPAELLMDVEIALLAASNERFAFGELARRHGDFAIAGVAARLRMAGSRVDEARVVLFSVADRPIVASTVGAALKGVALQEKSIREAQDALAKDVEPLGDIHNDAETKMHLLRVVLGRALRDLVTSSA